MEGVEIRIQYVILGIVLACGIAATAPAQAQMPAAPVVERFEYLSGPGTLRVFFRSPVAPVGTTITNQSVNDIGGGSRFCFAVPPALSCDVPDVVLGATHTLRPNVAYRVGSGPGLTRSGATFNAFIGTPPSVPLDFTAEPGTASGSIDLSWTEPANNGGADISSYEVLIDGAEPLSGCMSLTTETSCTITDIGDVNEHELTVAARNAGGLLGPAAMATASPRQIVEGVVAGHTSSYLNSVGQILVGQLVSNVTAHLAAPADGSFVALNGQTLQLVEPGIAAGQPSLNWGERDSITSLIKRAPVSFGLHGGTGGTGRHLLWGRASVEGFEGRTDDGQQGPTAATCSPVRLALITIWSAVCLG